MPSGKSIADLKSEVQRVLASELTSRKISYMRSDGSQWTLSLKEVIDRATHFEMAYNPNDCVEVRWGASEGSEEASTCKRHAPQAHGELLTGRVSAIDHANRKAVVVPEQGEPFLPGPVLASSFHWSGDASPESAAAWTAAADDASRTPIVAPNMM